MQHNVIISLPLAEFTALITETVQTALAAQPAPLPVALPADPNEFITRKEAAAFLRVSLPTLNDWTKSRKITGYRIGRSVRYRRSELADTPAVICPHNNPKN